MKKLDELKYYVKIPLSHFKVAKDIIQHGKGYDFIAVEIPFTIEIKDIQHLPKFIKDSSKTKRSFNW